MIEVHVVYMFKCCFKVFLQDEVFNVPTVLSPKGVETKNNAEIEIFGLSSDKYLSSIEPPKECPTRITD